MGGREIELKSRIWLIGGTSDSAEIARVLAESNLPLVISVTTAAATALYADSAVIRVGCLDRWQMKQFCQENSIGAIVDASHPYAVAVSSQAVAVAKELNLPYLRYERQHYQTPTPISNDAQRLDLASFEQLLAGDYLIDKRVLLTVGCKVLPQFRSWQSRAILFARILPKIASLETAIAAGFSSDRIIAIRPPISLATETALWQQWQISLVVTKASGKVGGEDIKQQVATNLGIPLVVIARPPMTYPQQTSQLKDVLSFSCRYLDRHSN